MHSVDHPALTVQPAPAVEPLYCREWAVTDRPQFRSDGFGVFHPDLGHGWQAARVCDWSGAFVPTGPVLDGDGNVLDDQPA